MPSTSSSARQADVETAINYEIGYKYINERLNVNITGFYSDYDNILGSGNVSGGGAGTGDIFNAGNAVIKGLELSMDYQIKIGESNLPMQLAYTFTDARFKETFVNAGGDWGSGTIMAQDMIPFITPHLWSGSLGFDYKKFNIILSARYVGATRTKPGQNILILPDDNVLYNDVKVYHRSSYHSGPCASENFHTQTVHESETTHSTVPADGGPSNSGGGPQHDATSGKVWRALRFLRRRRG